MDRITKQNLENRIKECNRLLNLYKSEYNLVIGGRNGMIFVDQYKIKEGPTNTGDSICGGTKKECYETLLGFIKAFWLLPEKT